MHIMSPICPINQGNNLFHETSISDLYPVEQTNKYIQGGSAHSYHLIRPVELCRAFWQSYFSGERGNPIPEVTILTMCNQVWLSCECSLGKPRNSPPLITFQSYCGSIFSPQDPSRSGEINQDNELIFLPQFFFFLSSKRWVYMLIILPWWGTSLFVSVRRVRPLGEKLMLMICMPSWRLLSSTRILESN